MKLNLKYLPLIAIAMGASGSAAAAPIKMARAEKNKLEQAKNHHYEP